MVDYWSACTHSLLTAFKNIGLSAKILSQRTFTIFVVMALVTTFATTPLTTALYPPWYQKKLAAWKRGEIDWDGNSVSQDSQSVDTDRVASEKQDASDVRRLLVYLRLESLPSLFTFVSLLGADRPGGPVSRVHPSKPKVNAGGQPDESTPLLQERPLQVHGLRMLELTERLSSVMKESEIDDVATKDPVVNAFHSFGQLNNLAVSGDVEIVPEGSYAEILSRSASEQASDMVLLPWSESGSLSETSTTTVEHSKQHMLENGPHSQFIATFLNRAPCHTAVFVNNGFGTQARKEHGELARSKSRLSLKSSHGLPSSTLADRNHHIFFPFFGGSDDRTAMRFVLRLAQNANVTATILFIDVEQSSTSTDAEVVPTSPEASRKNGVSVTASASQEIFFEQERRFFVSIKDSLSAELEPRVMFDTVNTAQPLHETINRAESEVGQSGRSSGDLIVLGRGCESRINCRTEMHHLLRSVGQTSHTASDVSQSLGDVAQVLMATEVKASLLVIQARKEDTTS